MKRLQDLTWKDAVLIELASMKNQIEYGRPIPRVQVMRLIAMVNAHWTPSVKETPARTRTPTTKR